MNTVDICTVVVVVLVDVLVDLQLIPMVQLRISIELQVLEEDSKEIGNNYNRVSLERGQSSI